MEKVTLLVSYENGEAYSSFEYTKDVIEAIDGNITPNAIKYIVIGEEDNKTKLNICTPLKINARPTNISPQIIGIGEYGGEGGCLYEYITYMRENELTPEGEFIVYEMVDGIFKARLEDENFVADLVEDAIDDIRLEREHETIESYR